MNIGVLNYGAGNLKNICRAIEHLGFQYSLVSSANEINTVDKLIIPGVGAFKVAMEQLLKLNLIDSIKQLSLTGTPIMGVCLGMQLLFEKSSEFGMTNGLGLLEGDVNLIPSVGSDGKKLKVPHIGWNELTIDNDDCKIIEGLKKNDAVYFVHSYRVENYNPLDLVAHSIYDGWVLPAIVQKNNIIGCQFHPEKSGTVGLNILNIFLKS